MINLDIFKGRTKNFEGSRLTDLIIDRNLTYNDFVHDLYKRTGYLSSRQSVNSWEKGGEPRGTALFSLCLFFGVPVEHFFN